MAAERRFDSEGVSIYFRVSGAGPPVVLLHGAFLDGEATFGRVEPVLARSYRLVIPDLRGHGSSNKPTVPASYGAELYLDVLRLLDHLELPAVTLLGYSMGGALAQKVAVEVPGRVTHLIVGGVGWTPPDGFADGQAFAELLETSGSVRGALDPERTNYGGDVAKALDRMSLEVALALRGSVRHDQRVRPRRSARLARASRQTEALPGLGIQNRRVDAPYITVTLSSPGLAADANRRDNPWNAGVRCGNCTRAAAETRDAGEPLEPAGRRRAQEEVCVVSRRILRHVAVTLIGSWSLPACVPAAEEAGGLMRFDTAVFLEDSAATSANVSAGDVDADGHMDLVLVKGRHWPLVDIVLLGDGQGSFETAYPVGPEPDRSYSGLLVDLDRDGDLDVVVSNDQPDPKVVHLNDGTGRFTPGSSFGRPEWSTRHVNVADFDQDSVPDVVLANRYGDEAGPSFVCFGDGAGGFDSPCVAVAEGSATTITPADVNGDGAPDLVFPHRDGGQSYVYLNDGSGGFNEMRPFGPPDATIRSAKAGDLNGDGLLDLAVIDERTGPAVYTGTADGGFASAVALGDGAATPYAIEVADLDQDGSPDIIIGHVESRPIAYLNDGAGAFRAVPFGDDEGVAYGFAVADFDEDGLMDIAMARSDARNVLYLGSRAAPLDR